MKIFRSLDELASDAQPSVVTIGNFDGVHRGHRMVIASVLERARARDLRSFAVTFDPHPADVLRGTHLRLLTPLTVRLDLLAQTGLDAVLVLPFTDELRHWSARQFAERVLRNALQAVEVHEGETFRFGFEQQAGVEGLSDLGRELGFTVRAYDPFLARGAAISSSRIRHLLTDGRLSEARALLGRAFSVHSTPASGRGYGTRYTVPTINLAPYADLLPANGVYVTTLAVGAQVEGTRTFRGVTNVGNRPTFGEDSFAVETYLFGFEPIALSETTPLEMTFLHRLREERKFASPELLRAQIGRDVAKAQRFFALCDARATATPF